MSKHLWVFSSRFRRHAFGWRSQTPIKRIQEAVTEIRRVARKDPLTGAEGAVLFLEKVSGAIEQVDGSSGAIGGVVNKAIDELVPIISAAPAADELRKKWLERLWQAVQDDDMPYLESLPEHWGDLCVTKETASRWADEFIGTVRAVWGQDRPPGGWFKGITACLSALCKAERYEELLDLIASAPHQWWLYRRWGVEALAAQGRVADAIAYAEVVSDPYASPLRKARTCEHILLAAGKVEEAYSRYAIDANRRNTNLATFRAIAVKYPEKTAAEILEDLVKDSPGEEGKWFAAAKSAGLFAEALELANRTPCDPRTLTRAARDMATTHPEFAMEAGLAALRWLVAGHGYEIDSRDVSAAYRYTMSAARNAGRAASAEERLRAFLEAAEQNGGPVVKLLQELTDASFGADSL